MIIRKNRSFYIRKRDSLLKRLRTIGPFVSGSMVIVSRRCGNPNCHCATGKKHQSYYITYKAKGKTTAVYVPVDLEEEAKGWVQEYKRLKRLVKEISDLQKEVIRVHVRSRRRKNR